MKRKKLPFKLNPDWMFKKKPVDFEYNKYTLLDYLQKCEKGFNNLEVYPDFVELSLHLANIQTLSKENRLLTTNKVFESCDDEILVKELVTKKPRELKEKEIPELEKTIKYCGGKLFDAFNMAKSIWNIAYDNIEVSLKRNKSNLTSGSGYIFFYKKSEDQVYIWEYEIKKVNNDPHNNRTYLNLIYKAVPDENKLISIIENFSTWNNTENYKDLPIFEVKCQQDFPYEQTFLPILKRKILAYVFQIVNLEKINNFDSEA